jgi:RecA/RadA recombinase
MSDSPTDDLFSQIDDLLQSDPEKVSISPQVKAKLQAKLTGNAKTKKTNKPTTKASAKPTTKAPVKSSTKTPETALPGRSKVKRISPIPLPGKVGILSDNRKLTNKGKESLRARWSVERSGESRDGFMKGLIDTAREKFGAERVFGSRADLEQLAVGIPMPSLALEYLLANDIFPIDSVVMLAGSWGCCKSALSYEIFRWFYDLSGMAIHIDTENKFDADFACDIMQIDKPGPDDQPPIISNRADSLETMQQILTHYLVQVQKMLIGTKEAPGPGKSIPCCFCIDSLAGAASEESQEKILKEGNANRAHPIAALKNTGYLVGIKKQFQNWPFTLLVVNHLKEKTDEMGNTREYTLGGQSFNFHESFELRNSIWHKRFNNSQWEGIGVRIQCAKNSFGPTGRTIKTRFLWWTEDDPETGEPRDRFLWDWNWTLVNLLFQLDGKEKARLIARDIVVKTQNPKGDLECMANIRALGMGPDEYLPYQEVGQMIQDNEDVSRRIRAALNIKVRRKLIRPYDEIIEDYRKSAE